MRPNRWLLPIRPSRWPLPEPIPPSPSPTSTPLPKAGPYIGAYTSPGQGLLIFDIRILTLMDGWAIGRADYEDYDHVLTTADAGYNWQDVTPPQPSGADMLRADAFYLDVDSSCVIYTTADHFTLLEEYYVWCTGDRGQSWQISAPLELTGLEEFFVPQMMTFADPQTGWLSVSVGAGMSHNFTNLYQTLDGGATWMRVLDPLNGEGLQSCEKTGLVFADMNSGWAGLNCRGLYGPMLTFAATTDGGAHWAFVDLPAPHDKPDLYTSDKIGNCYSHSLNRFTFNQGVVGVTCEQFNLDEPAYHYLYVTEDGGNTWKSLKVPEGTWHFYTFYQAYLTGPEIWHTNNQGGSVARIAAMEWEGDFNFINSQMGWAVSHNSGTTTLYRTIDSGVTWEKLSPVIGP